MKNLLFVLCGALFLLGACKESTIAPPDQKPEPTYGNLYYTALDLTTGIPAIYSIHSDGTNRRKILDSAGLFSTPYGATFVGVRLIGEQSYPVVCALDGTVRTIATMLNGDYPVLSPKGDKIVYRRSVFVNQRQVAELHVVNIDGSGDMVLESEAAHETIPAWSPDGSMIAYFKVPEGPFSRPERDSLFVIGSNGTGRRFLTLQGLSRNDNFEGLDWSPDGRKLVCVAEPSLDLNEILVVDVATGNAQTITSDGISKAMPVWSPDGSSIAYVAAAGSEQDLRAGVFVVRANGANVTEYPVSTRHAVAYPQWSPDGGSILVTELNAGNNDNVVGTLKVITVNGGAVRPIDDAVYKAFWRR